MDRKLTGHRWGRTENQSIVSIILRLNFHFNHIKFDSHNYMARVRSQAKLNAFVLFYSIISSVVLSGAIAKMYIPKANIQKNDFELFSTTVKGLILSE